MLYERIVTCKANFLARMDDLTFERKENKRYLLRSGTADEWRHQTFCNRKYYTYKLNYLPLPNYEIST